MVLTSTASPTIFAAPLKFYLNEKARLDSFHTVPSVDHYRVSYIIAHTSCIPAAGIRGSVLTERQDNPLVMTKRTPRGRISGMVIARSLFYFHKLQGLHGPILSELYEISSACQAAQIDEGRSGRYGKMGDLATT